MTMTMMKRGLLAAFTVLSVVTARTQQVPDPSFSPRLDKPEYPAGRGPMVVIDAAHLNFHTAEGGYAPFANLLRADGYRVSSNHEAFTTERLARGDVLVISNAMHKQSEADWAPLPTLSAFSEAEIAAVERWVGGGGSLLLIADHMPLAGHAEALAAAFGVRFQNGFALDAAGGGQITFRRSDASLPPGRIADGRGASERVDTVITFTGQAFRLDPSIKAEPLLVFREGYNLLLPEVAFKFSDRTPRIPAVNLLQGAIVYHGQGRLAVLGEAAMFSAQLAGPNQRPMGMNMPEARENPRFALNVMHWLSGALN